MFLSDIEEVKLKLQQICELNELDMSIQSESYPITFTFERRQTALHYDELDEIPYIRFTYCRDTDFRAVGHLNLDKADLDKLGKLCDKLHILYLQHWFCRKEELREQELRRMVAEHVTPMFATNVGVVCLVGGAVMEYSEASYV